jgi:DNA-binding XRE family transcriptional regulator
MAQSKVGNIKDKVDRGLLHEYLWKHRTRTNHMSGSQDDLAEGLGISKTAMSLILKEMAEYGMLIKIRRGTWQIVDPVLYAMGEKPVEDGRLFDE